MLMLSILKTHDVFGMSICMGHNILSNSLPWVSCCMWLSVGGDIMLTVKCGYDVEMLQACVVLVRVRFDMRREHFIMACYVSTLA